ncbi:ribosome-inactivating family protein [Arcanobacterium phocae]|uniref:ribosome-inactivating family protein n=1 Tax=Arcanobacterium phocae TaxID=131112 RepID=UPI001C0F2845|nr:ribosome-inactivating family protein [Arcanobacterium phocae]
MEKVKKYFSAVVVAVFTLVTFPAISYANDTQITWNLSGVDSPREASKYKEVQKQIRESVARPLSNGVYAIPGNSSPSLIEIHLSSNSGSTATLYMRSDNLYVQGFRIGDGTRYATNDADFNGLFEGFTSLGFGSDYSQLQSAGGVTDLSLWGLGAGALDTLTHNITFDANASNQATFRRTAARLILTSALMFGEGTRFSPSFGNEIATSIADGLPYLPTLADQELIRDWGHLSTWGREAAQNPTQPALQLPPHVYANPNGLVSQQSGTQSITSLLILSWLVGVIAAPHTIS